jgi:uncharacterized protein YbjQ (UPF0145 family)
MKTVLTIILIISIQGCAARLTSEGMRVRLVESQVAHNCVFVGTVTGSNSMGNTTAQDADGALNELRNKAARLGANAVRVISISSSAIVTTTVGEALICEF